jgi:hypothetical protein
MSQMVCTAVVEGDADVLADAVRCGIIVDYHTNEATDATAVRWSGPDVQAVVSKIADTRMLSRVGIVLRHWIVLHRAGWGSTARGSGRRRRGNWPAGC